MAAATVQGRKIFLLLLLFSSLVSADGCKIGSFDVSTLHSFSPWNTINDFQNATIQISLCGKLAQDKLPNAHNCADGTSICLTYPNGTSISYGNYSSNASVMETPGGPDGVVLLMLKGQPCPGHLPEFYSTIFYFKCGKTLGYPKYMGDFLCSTHFEWKSYLFCKNLPAPDKEVPCAVVKDGRLIDLSPLTKLTGAHLVEADEAHQRKILINVCRDITPGNDDTKNCPKGSAACRVIAASTDDFGQPTTALESTPEGARLVYTSATKPDNCFLNPSTTINFRCPERGGSKPPILLTDFLLSCSAQIEWVTEFACPTDYITSSTCQLNKEEHDIDIDLSLLKHLPLQPYVVNVTDGQDHYRYYINICDTVAACNNDGVSSVCQQKDNDNTFSQSLGKKDSMELMYSDGVLTLTYKNGHLCSSNFERETIIEFSCNRTAVNNGLGAPEFVQHTNCTYFFQWGTKLACVDQPTDGTCRLDVDGKRFDLSELMKEKDSNWQVITGENEADNMTYFLNVCHDILPTGAASACPLGSAVCRKGSSGSVSLGRFTQSLQYDKASQSLRLNYTEPSQAAGQCSRSTTVSFYCAPGNLVTAPSLVYKSIDDCHFDIEWHTAAACVLSRKTGDNCRVFDDSAGYSFDLNPLTLTKGGYSIDGPDGYKYLLNVCARIIDGKYCTTKSSDNAAICQIKEGPDRMEFKVGEPSSKLEYFDGVLNLTYVAGEPYNDAHKTPRTAEIAFICDVAAGVGKPEFLEEKNLTYAFLWRTSYACPVNPIECAVTDGETHQQYDLSSLTKPSHWEILSNLEPNNRKKFYVNVCRPVGPIQGVLCSPLASVCATNLDSNGKETLFHGNLGQAMTSPVIERSIKGVKLIYTNGDSCVDEDNNNRNFTTTIHFACANRQFVGGQPSPIMISPCEYSILWETEMACAIDNVQTQDTKNSTCTVKDPNSGFVFNLTPLAKDGGYDILNVTGSKNFKVNLCHALPDSVCGTFSISNSTGVCDGQTAVAQVSTSLEYSSQGEFTLTYNGKTDIASGSNIKYVFNIFCDRSAQEAQILFSGVEYLSTNFHVRTALACPPQPVSCVVQDAMGRQYDLTPLAREVGNWVVIDSRPNHGDLRYHINVCRPVNPTADMTCAGGAVGACQTSSQKNESFSMGFVQSEPVVSSTNSAVTIHYEGGERCHIGKDHEALRSTRIIFFCDTVEHNPVFEAESDSCEYTFVWKTPSACPQKVVSGNDCKVTEPLYNFEFDLSMLRTTTKDYIVKGNNYEFHINVCGPLINGSGQCQSAGACQVGSTLSSPIPAGLPNNQPKYESGQITLVYSDGKANCHQKYNRSTIILFVCDHSQVGDAGPKYLEEKSDCTYVFEWPTKAACPPHQVTECTVENGKDIYDLSRLSRPDGNYQRVYNDSNREYIINICRSLVHKKGQTCPFDAAACMIDLAETDPKKRYHNIGEVTSHSLRIEQGVLVLSYENGEPCGMGRKSTTIVFQCDEGRDSLGTPSSHFELNGCEDHFVWLSSAACPLRQDDQPSQGFGDCKATNPNTGYEFDLNSLKKDEGYTTYDRDGHEFVLNVCGWLDTKSQCNNGTGVCQVDQVGAKTSVNSGLASAQMLYKDGVLVLEYKNGDKCSTGASRATSINFVCDQDAGKGVPVYIDRSGDCNFYFTWETDLACETEVKCEVDTDSGFTLDFSSLIMKSGNNLVLPLDAGSHHNVGLIYVNLCRPLNPIFGTLCPPGSAACLVRVNESPLNLGHIDQEPVYDKVTKEVKLTYTKGDSCSSNPKVNISSVIILKCSTNTGTSPELEQVTQDCQYVFVWETPLACPEPTAQKLSTDCSYYDHHLRVKYDLSSLSDLVQVKSTNATFILRPCYTEEKINRGSCSKSAVCQTDPASAYGSYGDFSHGMFQKDSDLLSLTFSEGKACNSGKSKAESTIFFQCDRTAGMGQPKLMTYESDCHVSFLWLTSLVCPQAKKKCLISSNGALFDFTFLSQDHGSWNVTDKDNNIYWLNLCQSVHGEATTAGCTESTAVCRKTASGKIEVLGKLDTQQITAAASSATNTSVSFRYSDGDAAVCGSGGRRRSDIAPNVSIKLMCGNTIGAPVFQVFKSDSCSFEFLWKTRLACAVSHDKLQVKQVNGVIYDVRTGLGLNLKSILEPTRSYEVTVNSDKYYINFGREVDLGIQQNIGCKGAAVCLKDTSSNNLRNLGALSSAAYFMEDEHLEIVFTSPENCSSGHLNVTTIFIFNCIEDNGLTKPSFVYKTSDCGYIFNWDTNVVCLKGNPAVKVPVIDSSSDEPHPSNDKGSNKVVLGVVIFIFIALVCISVLVLYKPERRAIIGSKMKRIFLCRKSQDGPIVYSRLSQSDGVEDDPFNPFNETEDESEINNGQLPPRVSTFHDDSDDDMLL